MGIKNMPDFDDIDISNEPKASNKPKLDIKALFGTFGITTIEQLKKFLTAFGYDKAALEEQLSGYSSLDDMQASIDALEETGAGSAEIQELMNAAAAMMPQMGQMFANMGQQSSTQNNTNSYSEDDLAEEDNEVLEEIIDDFLNGTTTSEECVNELCEFLADLDYCFDDLQHIEDSLDNMRNSGTTTKEIKKFIFDNTSDMQDDDDESESEEDEIESDDENPFGEPEEEKKSKEIKMFNDNLKPLLEREDKFYSVKYLPFSAKEFKNHFDLDDDDLEDNKLPISKFADILPESWTESFEYVTLATPFIDETNKFIICYLVPNFANNSVIPVNFLIYKNSAGYHIYVVKSENIINDDNTLLTLEDVYTPEAIEYCKKELNAVMNEPTDPMSMMMQNLGGGMGLSGFPLGGGQQPQQSTDVPQSKINKTLYRTLLQAIGGYDDKRTFEKSQKLMLREDSNPLMTLHMLGTLTPTLETKQYGNGYVYVGTVTLNDTEDVKYFLSDFELKPDNGKLDFYLKMENSEIKRNDLPKYKDFIRDHYDFNDDAVQNHLEVQALDNIVFIEF